MEHLHDPIALLFAYVHDIEKNASNHLPSDIYSIIYLFGFVFEWNRSTKRSGRKITFKNKDTVEYAGGYVESTAIAHNMLLRNVLYKVIEWEITINAIQYTYPANLCKDEEIHFHMGFVTHPIKESIRSFDDILIGDKRRCNKKFGVQINNNDSTNAGLSHQTFGVPNLRRFAMKYTDKYPQFGAGDKFSLIFDFEAMNISFYYNKVFQGIVVNNFDKNMKLIPAVSFYGSAQTLKTTTWNIVQFR